MGDTLPTGQLSNIPWRRAGVKYTNNEAYFDVIEEIDAIIDKSGKGLCRRSCERREGAVPVNLCDVQFSINLGISQ